MFITTKYKQNAVLYYYVLSTISVVKHVSEFGLSLHLFYYRTFSVTQKGVVNICATKVIVPNALGVRSAAFLVELSEAVQTHNVTVKCYSTSPTGGK